jgi:ElaB/YqjD/DUF883 family membrane-anchored ribosome-binding protein
MIMTHKVPAPTMNDLHSLAEDAQALLSATSDETGEHISEARKRLAAALESGRKMVGQAKDKAVQSVKSTDAVVREHPYVAIGIAFGVGAIVGYFLASALSRNRN